MNERLFPRIKFLQIKIAGNIFAAECSKIDEIICIDESFKVTCHGGGAAIVLRERVLPLIDYRSCSHRLTNFVGLKIIVVSVLSLQVAIILEQPPTIFYARCKDIVILSDAIREEFPYCEGSIYENGNSIHVIDLSKLLSPPLAKMKFKHLRRS